MTVEEARLCPWAMPHPGTAHTSHSSSVTQDLCAMRGRALTHLVGDPSAQDALWPQSELRRGSQEAQAQSLWLKQSVRGWAECTAQTQPKLRPSSGSPGPQAHPWPGTPGAAQELSRPLCPNPLRPGRPAALAEAPGQPSPDRPPLMTPGVSRPCASPGFPPLGQASRSWTAIENGSSVLIL